MGHIFVVRVLWEDTVAQITLFDGTGKPVAYIDHDDESTIYSFEGEPLAYIDKDHVYGFNGAHLGWFQDGIIWDHGGLRTGFIKETSPVFIEFEPFKGFKQFKPFKGFQQFAPFQPFKSFSTSDTPLIGLLEAGRA